MEWGSRVILFGFFELTIIFAFCGIISQLPISDGRLTQDANMCSKTIMLKKGRFPSLHSLNIGNCVRGGEGRGGIDFETETIVVKWFYFLPLYNIVSSA